MEVKSLLKIKGDGSHPHPLGKNHIGAQLPPHRPPTKKLSRGRSPKKYANKKIFRVKTSIFFQKGIDNNENIW